MYEAECQELRRQLRHVQQVVATLNKAADTSTLELASLDVLRQLVVQSSKIVAKAGYVAQLAGDLHTRVKADIRPTDGTVFNSDFNGRGG